MAIRSLLAVAFSLGLALNDGTVLLRVAAFSASTNTITTTTTATTTTATTNTNTTTVIKAVATTPTTALLFGPTANLPSDQLSALVSGLVTSKGLDEWSALRKSVVSSDGGALHVRLMALASLNASAQKAFAHNIIRYNAGEKRGGGGDGGGGGLGLSMEAGGALCGRGKGRETALSHIQRLLPSFVAAGGTLSHVMLESVYSRTFGACPEQSHVDTARELAEFAQVYYNSTLASDAQFWLYDALPHYAVELSNVSVKYLSKESSAAAAAATATAASAASSKIIETSITFPQNDFPAKYNLSLGPVLTMTRDAMQKHGGGTTLVGYWADSPREYSAYYPCVTAPKTPRECVPVPKGPRDGYAKIKAALQLVQSIGLQFGKTFNSQVGGQTSSQAFYNGTMDDWVDFKLALARQDRISKSSLYYPDSHHPDQLKQSSYAKYSTAVAPGRAGSAVATTVGTADAIDAAALRPDGVMVETWYSYPDKALPESTPYTTAWTASAIFPSNAEN